MDSLLREKELVEKSNEFKEIQNEIKLKYAIDVYIKNNIYYFYRSGNHIKIETQTLNIIMKLQIIFI